MRSRLIRRIVVLLCLGLALGACRPAPQENSAAPASTPWRELAPEPATATTAELPEPQESSPVSATMKTSVVPSRVRELTKFPLRDSSSNLPLELPGPAQTRKIDDAQLSEFQEIAAQTQSAADWRKAAERAVAVNDFFSAHQAYARESEIYRKKGHLQAALAEEMKAAQYATELQLYQSRPSKPVAKLSRLEPAQGCYVGAFIDRDTTLEKHYFESQTHGDIPQFNELVGKKHASFFMYRSYGKPFPSEWAEFVKSQGAIPHIAWEPGSIDEVKNDAYLASFLDAAKRLEHPVMLRFASEMNGEWTHYNGDPEAYKKAFRLVYTESRKAPQVALMWCPNAVPKSNVEEYYPGDDFVDWVGVNFYSVPFLDNDPQRSGEKIHPTDHLKFVYETYSSKKPIAIGEWAASQKSILSERDLVDFATGKLSQLYATLPTKYPKVKMVNWYNCNNIEQAKEERQLNNFQITNSEQILSAYRKAVSNSYFLGTLESTSPHAYDEIGASVVLGEGEELKLFLKSYDPVLRVYFQVGDKVLLASDDPLEWYLSARQLQSFGQGLLKVLVYDSQNRFVARREVKFQGAGKK